MMPKSPFAVPSGSRVLLLDLVWTFALRPGLGTHRDYARAIEAEETYRLELLARIRREGFAVVLLTARRQQYQEVTLANIARHAGGWQPDWALFNETEDAPESWKRFALHQYVFPTFGAVPARFLALESNARSRAMFNAEGIEALTWETYLGQSDSPTAV